MPPSTQTNRAAASGGLRERKKVQTRAAIQRHALRLFHENGYQATTMEQVAAAADISPSTLYRYFPTKEDLVLIDDYDPLLAAAFRAQPPEIPPVEALRSAIRTVLSGVVEADQEQAWERSRLALTIPEVRAKAIDHLVETSDMFSELFAERAGRAPDDYAVRVLAGTVIGAMLAAQMHWVANDGADMVDLIDEALRFVSAGPAMLDR